jgi:hypothetical protein
MKFEGKNWFGLFWIVFFAGIMITSLGYGYKARLIPLVVTIPCLAFSIYRFIVDLKGKEKHGPTLEDELMKGVMHTVEEVAGGHKKKKKEKLSLEEMRKRFFDVALWIIAFIVMIYVLGFLIAIPLFTFAYMKIKKEGWVISILCTVGIWLGVYLAFVVGTRSYLHEGLLIPLLRGQ